jgi:hypothetical protein
VDDHDLFDDEFSETTTVADLLAWLERRADLGEQFTEMTVVDDCFELRSVLGDHTAFCDQRLALAYALVAAPSGMLSINGASYDAIDTLLVDVDLESIRIRTPDPQNLSYEQWDERMGGIEASEAAFAAWRKKKQRRR